MNLWRGPIPGPLGGVDVSSYQGNIAFDVLDVSFIIAKAVEGIGYVDHTFARNWSEAKRVGLRRGAYAFVRPDLGNDAESEAAYFLSVLGPLDPGDMLALDYEVQWGGNVVGWCKAWLDAVRVATGIVPLIYLNLSLVRGHDWTPVFGYPLWLALYDENPTSLPQTPWPVAIKQWTSSGTVSGIPSARVDLNTAFGEDMTPEEVIALIEQRYDLTNTLAAVKAQQTKEVTALREAADKLKNELA